MTKDDVIDYMIIEAIALKANEEEKEADKKRKVQEWKSNTDELRKQIGQ